MLLVLLPLLLLLNGRAAEQCLSLVDSLRQRIETEVHKTAPYKCACLKNLGKCT